MAVTLRLAAVALLAVAAAEKANGKYSQKQAQCLLKDRKIAILGDSNSRYWSLSFNQFLDQGILLNCYNKKGCTDRKTHDKYEIWTQAYGRSGDGTHLQRMTKSKFSGNGPKQTDYWR